MPKPDSTVERGARWLWGVAALAVLYPIALVVLAHIHSGGQDGFPLDDPWIHLTFARNLHEHGTFSYFPGTPARAGSTSPLFTMLLAIGFLFTSNEKLLAYVLGAASQLLFLVALAQWARHRLAGSGGRSWLWAALVTLLVGLDSRIGILAISGMETPLYLAFVAMAFWGRASRRRWLFGASLGASLWVRPDSLILFAVFAIDLGIEHWRSRTRAGATRPAARTSRAGKGAATRANHVTTDVLPRSVEAKPVDLWTGFVLAGAVALVYFAFHLVLFHHLLPNTFAAKTAYYQLVPRAAFLVRDLPNALTANGWIVLAAFALLALGREIVSLVRGRPGLLRAEAGWTVALCLAYFVLLPFSHRFSRYLMPALPAFAILGVSSLQWIANLSGRIWRPVAIVLGLGALGAQGYGVRQSIADYEGRCLYQYVRQERAGRWIEANTPPDAVIATHDIGAIAYYSHRRIVDIVGILDPEIVPYLGKPEYIPHVKALLEREGVSYLAVLRNWLEVANVDPVFRASDQPELLEIYRWDPDTVHLVPKPASDLNVEAAARLDAKDLAGAQQALQLSLRIDPANSRTWYLLAISEEMGKQYADAVKHYRKTYALFPKHYDARYRESQVLLASGQKLEAARALHALLDVKPDYPTALERFQKLRDELGPEGAAIVGER
ncbi:MAG: tetratricopeptide repeat protein [Candidatus Eisenbacteria bacterium]|uniref:Tetratricopeptide repeat protein n=1 Tax=Eiseniibacteriota bacterium TaxID=2212470 RepID=A0A956LZ61_UNCEI|nr:tetratricopeptide repeat protein [Candidatus Eisenbacteria bacterium]